MYRYAQRKRRVKEPQTPLVLGQIKAPPKEGDVSRSSEAQKSQPPGQWRAASREAILFLPIQPLEMQHNEHPTNRLRLLNHRAVSVEARYVHWSCAGISDPNLGLNGVTGMLGLSLFF
jgi:hypothetical protein